MSIGGLMHIEYSSGTAIKAPGNLKYCLSPMRVHSIKPERISHES